MNRLLSKLILCFLVVVACMVGFSHQASAANGAAFNPGRIIDDSIFTNKSSLSVADIQWFLDSKVPSCRAGYTCLKNYVEGGKTSAQIIWEESQNYNLNPQVIIVTLQKETGLITDTWPEAWQYRTAMGFACPDGGSCDPAFYGFTNQVHQGARHFRNFFDDNPNWFVPYRTGSANIKWHPNAGCGTSNVFIETRGTAALYSYTPYRPNPPALNNIYGTGDACSSYGNRNFWRDFTDWFGSTTGAPRDFSLYSATQSVQWSTPGQTLTNNEIQIRNTGYTTWYPDGNVPVGQHPTRLALAGYQNTPFADTSDPAWLGTQNQIKMALPQGPVPPGEYAKFIFKLKGPYAYINGYVHRFVPVTDSVAFFPDKNLQFINYNIAPPYAFVSAVGPPSTMYSNQKNDLNVILKNTGTVPWYADGSTPPGVRPMRIAGIGYQTTPYANIYDPAWLGTRNQVKMTPAIVNPGENATFNFSYVGPFSGLSNTFRFYPFLDGVGPLKDIGMGFATSTPARNTSYQVVSSVNPPATMAPGSVANVQLTLKNTGSVVWRNEANGIGVGNTRLGMTQPYYRPSKFYSSTDANWLTSSQIGLTTATVAPGQNGVFNFQWKAPMQPGTYTEWFAPVLDSVQWMPDIGMGFRVTVQ